MEIYIKSRGKKIDYRWHEISAEGEESIFNFPNNIIDKFKNLINPKGFSLLLAFFNNELLLLITGLEPKKNYRVDSSGTSQRIIRNSLVLISSFFDESIFRSIIISALRGELAQKLEDIIEFDRDIGFQVTAKYDNLVEQLMPEVEIDNFAPSLEGQSSIRLLSDDSKEQLANELQRYSLPKKEGILVIVTKYVSESDLREERVLRGLTPYMTPHLTSRNRPSSKPEFVNNLIKQVISKLNTKIFLILVFVSLVLLGVSKIKMISTRTNPPVSQNPSEPVSIVFNVPNYSEKFPFTRYVGEKNLIQGNYYSSLIDKKKNDNSNFSANLITKNTQLNLSEKEILNIKKLIEVKIDEEYDISDNFSLDPKTQTWSIYREDGFNKGGERKIEIKNEDNSKYKLRFNPSTIKVNLVEETKE
ncbi:MAG: hypothetical protein QNJ55_30665 [Xenococcus sp. MO_188.B8]|nr:hypothetical protein [Xenococcus sp. MO_188.B8]